MSLQWYVLRTKPHSESLASSALSKLGLDVFSPIVQAPSSEVGFVSKPLFPGYLFLRSDMESDDMELINRLPGVLGWVRFEGITPVIPPEVITELAQRVKRINESGGLWERFRPGDRVQVAYGTMESLGEVIEEAESPHARVRVLLDFMGRMVSAKVPWSSLSPENQDSKLSAGGKRRRRTRGGGRWVRGFGPRSTATA